MNANVAETTVATVADSKNERLYLRIPAAMREPMGLGDSEGYIGKDGWTTLIVSGTATKRENDYLLDVRYRQRAMRLCAHGMFSGQYSVIEFDTDLAVRLRKDLVLLLQVADGGAFYCTHGCGVCLRCVSQEIRKRHSITSTQYRLVYAMSKDDSQKVEPCDPGTIERAVLANMAELQTMCEPNGGWVRAEWTTTGMDGWKRLAGKA